MMRLSLYSFMSYVEYFVGVLFVCVMLVDWGKRLCYDTHVPITYNMLLMNIYDNMPLRFIRHQLICIVHMSQRL